MSFPRSPAVAVWLLATTGACSIGDAWAHDAQTGKAHPWVLLAVFWGAALLSVSIHYLLVYLARATAWTRRSWHRHAAQRERLRVRAWVYAAFAWATVSAAIARTAPRLVGSYAPLVRSLASQGWDVAKDAARRVCEQPMSGARRAPGALIGWSRAALRTLRV
jgi:hypothetical protein